MNFIKTNLSLALSILIASGLMAWSSARCDSPIGKLLSFSIPFAGAGSGASSCSPTKLEETPDEDFNEPAAYGENYNDYESSDGADMGDENGM